jgi:pyruvate kinase
MTERPARTKIVCTIGPASGSPAIAQGMMHNGMCVARLNMAHGSLENHRHYIDVVRTAAAELDRPLALLLDLPGPKYRTGKVRGGEVELRPNTIFVLSTEDAIGDERGVSIKPPSLPDNVQTGDHILLSDGDISLLAEEVSAREVRCRVLVGGHLKDNRGLVVPGRVPSSPFVTEQMLRQLDFGIKHKVDYFALSFVYDAENVRAVRRVLEQKGAGIPLVSKIETGQAVTHLGDILAASDAVLVARGDLGAELPLERVPVLQKQIVGKCNHLGKPVIVATQMLESMVQAPQPTRAEVADVANAVFDGADAVMLSEETSIGLYPEASTAMMSRIATEAEAALPYQQILAERSTYLVPKTDDAIAFNACHTAQQLGAAAIVAFTESGSTAFRVAKYRPAMPLLALTSSEGVRRRLAIVWGVQAYIVSRPATVDDMFAQAVRLVRELKVASKGDLVVVTAGVPIGIAGTTNLLKVLTVD